MSNSVFNLLGNNNSNSHIPFSNMNNLMSQFKQFQSQFKGDPKQQVQELLNSGKMTQSQFNQLRNMANEFQKMFK